MRRTAIALLLSGLMTGAAAMADTGAGGGGNRNGDSFTVAADAEVQAAIADFVAADTPSEQSAALDRLKTQDDASRANLVTQLLIYSNRASGTKEAMAAGAVIRQLNIGDRDLAIAAIPLLDAADTDVVKTVRSVLGGIEGIAPGRRPDYSIHRELLAEDFRNGSPMPDGLIRHMYQTDPGEALLSLMRVQQIRDPARLKEILWTEHVVSDVLWKQRNGFLKPDEIEPAAATELAKASADDAWWVRLYAAEIMRQHQSLRSPGVIEQLQQDGNDLVRKAAEQIAE